MRRKGKTDGRNHVLPATASVATELPGKEKRIGSGVADGLARSGIASPATRPSLHSGPACGCPSQAVLAPRTQVGSRPSATPSVATELPGKERRIGSGVADGTRTHDNRNHNPGLYQLSYSHHRKTFIDPVRINQHQNQTGLPDRSRTCDPRLRRPMLYPAELRAV